mmetsp:Transcript_12297/g.38256  ORF Transcript_12297/g.38256 Transcript_12297/m.38256 type:complete len:261 (-) Transcript_12297:254-1036(-)
MMYARFPARMSSARRCSAVSRKLVMPRLATTMPTTDAALTCSMLNMRCRTRCRTTRRLSSRPPSTPSGIGSAPLVATTAMASAASTPPSDALYVATMESWWSCGASVGPTNTKRCRVLRGKVAPLTHHSVGLVESRSSRVAEDGGSATASLITTCRSRSANVALTSAKLPLVDSSAAGFAKTPSDSAAMARLTTSCTPGWNSSTTWSLPASGSSAAAPSPRLASMAENEPRNVSRTASQFGSHDGVSLKTGISLLRLKHA